ncbi:alanine dehydrogenase [Enterococcus sp. PF1-24]|nr:alanine dehydrogenase [Enterococcus sp. PFB1-1]MDH6401375.1 alanine dehydrogenase [Enterococcus sp. PF1-24]
MKLGFIQSTFPDERRVPLLPEDIHEFENELLIESGFGAALGIADESYRQAGCKILSRAEVFQEADGIFCLKLMQPEDYDRIRPEQMIIG